MKRGSEHIFPALDYQADQRGLTFRRADTQRSAEPFR